MARETLQDVLTFNLGFMSGQFGAARLVEDVLYQLKPDSHIAQYVQCDTPGTVVRMPPVGEGKFFLITNTGSQALAIETANGAALFTILPGEGNIIHTEGATWRRLLPIDVVYTVFGPEGPGASTGLVPSPGAAQAQLRFLGSDAQWHGAFGNTLLDGYSFITDGTNTANATGNDTFRLRSSSGKITITVTDGEAVFGDNANLSVNEAAVDHDALLNWTANKHVDHTAVSILTGSGLSGGGDISATRTINYNFQGMTNHTGAVDPADILPMRQISTSANRRTTVGELAAAIDHNALLNYVADQHVAHSGVSITPQTGLSGGGTIAASRTISLDFSALPTQAEAMASGDLFPFYDLSGAIHKKVSWNTLNTSLDHDVLTNFVANKHIDHSLVTITGTGNLTGGGDLTASRTLDMANMAQSTIKGRAAAAGTGTPTDLSASQVLTLIGYATTDSPQLTALNIGHATDTTLARVSAGDLSIEGNIIYRAGGTDVPVGDGGTGVSALTAYAVMCGGTTSTGPVQSIASVGTSGQVLKSNGAAALPTFQDEIANITFVIDGGGSTITTGIKGDLEVSFACTILQVTLLADQTGSIVIDIWKDTYANYPPDVADTITAAAKPTISAAVKSQDTTLTGWVTAVAAGSTLRFNVDSAASIQRVTLSLKVKKT